MCVRTCVKSVVHRYAAVLSLTGCLPGHAVCCLLQRGGGLSLLQLLSYKFLYIPLHVISLSQHSSVVPRLVEDVVAMATHTFASEECREAQVLRYLVFRNDVVGTLWFAHNELADLYCMSVNAITH